MYCEEKKHEIDKAIKDIEDKGGITWKADGTMDIPDILQVKKEFYENGNIKSKEHMGTRIEYDEEGKQTYFKDLDGNELFFDKEGNIVKHNPAVK